MIELVIIFLSAVLAISIGGWIYYKLQEHGTREGDGDSQLLLRERFKDIDMDIDDCMKTMSERMDTFEKKYSEEYQKQYTERLEKFELAQANEREEVKKELEASISRHVMAKADDLLASKSISPEDYEHFKKRVEKFIGLDAGGERMSVLYRLFDSTSIGVLSWQCRLIKLLRGGLAPEAEQSSLVEMGIPSTKYKQFLAKMNELELAEVREVPAYFLAPGAEWIEGYIDSPDQLRVMLSKGVADKKEKDYGVYLRDRLELIEPGLKILSGEQKVSTGKIDLVCLDGRGRRVVIEIKRSRATASDIGQILRYKMSYVQDYKFDNVRYMIVAPSVDLELQNLLLREGLEFREIPMDGSGAP